MLPLHLLGMGSTSLILRTSSCVCKRSSIKMTAAVMALSEGSAPECGGNLVGGIPQFVRNSFVEAMTKMHPGIIYDCNLEEQAMHGISFYGGFLLDRMRGVTYNYFTGKYDEDERMRDVIRDAMDVWKNDLGRIESKTRFGCNYRVNNLVYSILCAYA